MPLSILFAKASVDTLCQGLCRYSLPRPLSILFAKVRINLFAKVRIEA